MPAIAPIPHFLLARSIIARFARSSSSVKAPGGSDASELNDVTEPAVGCRRNSGRTLEVMDIRVIFVHPNERFADRLAVERSSESPLPSRDNVLGFTLPAHRLLPPPLSVARFFDMVGGRVEGSEVALS